MIDFIRRHKVMCGVIALDVVFLLLAILALVRNEAKSATVEIYVAPVAAKIEMNGEEYENFSNYNVLPGEYHVVISMDGMQTREFDLEIMEDEFKRIRTYLLDEEGGFGYYRDHFDDELILENVADTKEAKDFTINYSKIHDIVDVLPIVYSVYADDYSDYIRYEIVQDLRDDCSKIVCLKIIDNTGGNEERAIEKIRESGYNPDDYEIKYSLELNESVRTQNE